MLARRGEVFLSRRVVLSGTAPSLRIDASGNLVIEDSVGEGLACRYETAPRCCSVRCRLACLGRLHSLAGRAEERKGKRDELFVLVLCEGLQLLGGSGPLRRCLRLRAGESHQG